MRAGDVHGTSGPDSRARRLSVRTPSVQDYFKRRARNWRARRFRVNALAPRPGRSRFAACVRRFATRGCVHGGLSGHRETFPRSGASGERSRPGYVSEVITGSWAGVKLHFDASVQMRAAMANPLAGSDALVSDTFATSPQEFLQTDNLPHLSQGQPKPRIHALHQRSNDAPVSSGARRQRPVRDDAGPVRRMWHACPKQTEFADLRPKLRGAAFEQRAIRNPLLLRSLEQDAIQLFPANAA